MFPRLMPRQRPSSAGRILTAVAAAAVAVPVFSALPTIAAPAPTVQLSEARQSAAPRPSWLEGFTRIVASTSDARFDARVDNQGWWATDTRANDENDNYLVGECPDCAHPRSIYHNFFTFDLSALDRKVVAAKLVLRRYQSGGDFIEIYGVFDVSTPAAKLNDNRGMNRRIWRDLGTGTRYGAFPIRTQGIDAKLNVGLWLNGRAVADINAARGGFFSVGGTVLSASTTDDHFDVLFGRSTGHGIQELRLYVEPPTA